MLSLLCSSNWNWRHVTLQYCSGYRMKCSHCFDHLIDVVCLLSHHHFHRQHDLATAIDYDGAYHCWYHCAWSVDYLAPAIHYRRLFGVAFAEAMVYARSCDRLLAVFQFPLLLRYFVWEVSLENKICQRNYFSVLHRSSAFVSVANVRVCSTNVQHIRRNVIFTVECLLWSIELIPDLCCITIVRHVIHLIVWIELLVELIVLCVLVELIVLIVLWMLVMLNMLVELWMWVELIVLRMLIELIVLHVWQSGWHWCWQKTELHYCTILLMWYNFLALNICNSLKIVFINNIIYLIAVTSQWIRCNVHIHTWHTAIQSTILMNRWVDLTIVGDIADWEAIRFCLDVIGVGFVLACIYILRER